MTRADCLDALRALVARVPRDTRSDRPLFAMPGQTDSDVLAAGLQLAFEVVCLVDVTFPRTTEDRDRARQVPMFDHAGHQEQLRKFGLANEKPRCAQCGEPFDHGCNSAYCSEACEDQAGRDGAHEDYCAGCDDARKPCVLHGS